MNDSGLIRRFIRMVLLEARAERLAQLSGGRTAPWGSDDHIQDLEARMTDAAYWRDRHPRRSETRGYYRNIHNSLKREFHSARRKRQIEERDDADLE